MVHPVRRDHEGAGEADDESDHVARRGRRDSEEQLPLLAETRTLTKSEQLLYCTMYMLQ